MTWLTFNPSSNACVGSVPACARCNAAARDEAAKERVPTDNSCDCQFNLSTSTSWKNRTKHSPISAYPNDFSKSSLCLCTHLCKAPFAATAVLYAFPDSSLNKRCNMFFTYALVTYTTPRPNFGSFVASTEILGRSHAMQLFIFCQRARYLFRKPSCWPTSASIASFKSLHSPVDIVFVSNVWPFAEAIMP